MMPTIVVPVLVVVGGLKPRFKRVALLKANKTPINKSRWGIAEQLGRFLPLAVVEIETSAGQIACVIQIHYIYSSIQLY